MRPVVVIIVSRLGSFQSILVPYLRPTHRNYMFVDLFSTVNKKMWCILDVYVMNNLTFLWDLHRRKLVRQSFWYQLERVVRLPPIELQLSLCVREKGSREKIGHMRILLSNLLVCYLNRVFSFVYVYIIRLSINIPINPLQLESSIAS